MHPWHMPDQTLGSHRLRGVLLNPHAKCRSRSTGPQGLTLLQAALRRLGSKLRNTTQKQRIRKSLTQPAPKLEGRQTHMFISNRVTTLHFHALRPDLYCHGRVGGEAKFNNF